MKTTRRGFVTAAGAAAAQGHGPPADHKHEHPAVPNDLTLRVKALESLLVEKGLVDRAALDALVDTYEHKVGPRNGAQVGRGPGSIRAIRSGCWRMARLPSRTLVLPARRASTWW